MCDRPNGPLSWSGYGLGVERSSHYPDVGGWIHSPPSPYVSQRVLGQDTEPQGVFVVQASPHHLQFDEWDCSFRVNQIDH